MEYSNLFVCLMGMGTVFIGLFCLVLLVSAMSAFFRKTKDNQPVAAPVAAAPVQPRMDNNKKNELMAAIAATIAEDMGTDISAVRIVSIKKV